MKAKSDISKKITENLVWVIITATFMLIPFYYNTTSSMSYTNEKIEVITERVESNEDELDELSGGQLVLQEKFNHIEKRLESIEKKLDYLIESSQ
ncbi:hypothetical protein [Parvicella tangerina]|uniref:Uncharacterized protein n=1 Tax=Parvicella tangerina TaxID=2829795 RepID=A0A916NU07_9FLAO|nr:hypothetical protein [Parvicella tangerina]CAG5086754.1 hypothetical protein CRYO30217_03266 [Parvicella tangerina]